MQAGLFILFIYFLCDVALRCVACSVYGALGWDPCSVYSVSSFFIGHWGWTFVALFSVCSVYEACRLVCLLYLFIYLFIILFYFILFYLFIYFFFIVWRGVAFCVAFMGHWGGALVASTAFVAFMRRLGWSPFCGI